MKLYYIKKTSLYALQEGFEYQYADTSTTPMLYTSKNKALRKAQRLTDYLAENCRYYVTLETDEISAKNNSCLYAALLKEHHSSFSMIIRVYEVKTQ